jgi:hypothetical protein
MNELQQNMGLAMDGEVKKRIQNNLRDLATEKRFCNRV